LPRNIVAALLLNCPTTLLPVAVAIKSPVKKLFTVTCIARSIPFLTKSEKIKMEASSCREVLPILVAKAAKPQLDKELITKERITKKQDQDRHVNHVESAY
jgi:hypothetical protein